MSMPYSITPFRTTMQNHNAERWCASNATGSVSVCASMTFLSQHRCSAPAVLNTTLSCRPTMRNRCAASAGRKVKVSVPAPLFSSNLCLQAATSHAEIMCKQHATLWLIHADPINTLCKWKIISQIIKEVACFQARWSNVCLKVFSH